MGRLLPILLFAFLFCLSLAHARLTLTTVPHGRHLKSPIHSDQPSTLVNNDKKTISNSLVNNEDDLNAIVVEDTEAEGGHGWMPAAGRFIDFPTTGRTNKLYIPSAASSSSDPLPLFVMLHGCTQNPTDFSKGEDTYCCSLLMLIMSAIFYGCV
jgi:hypothetical protein